MSRDLTVDMASEIVAPTIRPFYLFEADLSSEVLRLSSTNYDLSWDSETWLGNGWFRGLGSVRETGAIESSSLEVTLAGVSSALLALVLNYARQNLVGRIYLGMFNSSGSIIADPFVLWEGGLDVPKILDTDRELTIGLSYVSAMVILKRAREWRYTDQQQQTLFSGDKGFEFVTALSQWSGFWGNKEKPKTSKKNSKKKKSK